jgi:hypothetical protein
MAFDLLLELRSISSTAESAKITDITTWSEVPGGRADFGIFLRGLFYLSSDSDPVTIVAYNPLNITHWTAVTPENGRYQFTSYAFLIVASTEALVEGDVRVDTEGDLVQWLSSAWVPITLDAAVTAGKAYETSTPLEIPFLSYAYIYRNKLNLEYVAKVKNDIERGAEQNELYYKRTTLDYFYALILAAEYNWAMALYENYYQATENLNNIINTGNIS